MILFLKTDALSLAKPTLLFSRFQRCYFQESNHTLDSGACWCSVRIPWSTWLSC